MTQARLEQLLDLLACPNCRASLATKGECFKCTNGACGRSYSAMGGQPILVDFDESILTEDELKASAAGSAIQRGKAGGVKRRTAQVLLPSNRMAALNAARLIELASSLSKRPNILVVGGGSKGEGTEQLYSASELQLISFDIYASELTQFVADAHQIPLVEASMDAVWIQAVLEHVLDPWRVVCEIHRVLKPSGIVYAETPFLQQVHEGAYDFTRFTESGHRWLFRQFDEVDTGVVLGAASQLLWSIEHVARGLSRSVKVGVLAKIALFWLRFLDRMIPRAYASDAASAIYFLGRKSHSTIGPKDIIAFYKGAHARRN
jgi:SAM-dependent methyltransferase